MLHATRKISSDKPCILSEARPIRRWRNHFPVPQEQPDNPVHATPPQETGVLKVMAGSSLATLFSADFNFPLYFSAVMFTLTGKASS
jgi:hypothetical protein